MKPGDLVRGKHYGSKIGVNFEPLAGIIIRESERTNTWGEKKYHWWWILSETGQLIEEEEGYLELL